MKNRCIAIISFILIAAIAKAQSPQIIYSDPEREDTRRTDFEVIGKVGGNFLVYKNNRNDHDVCVYDTDMRLKDRVPVDAYFKDDQLINIDFVPYGDHCYAIYQYQKKNIVFCDAVKMDGNAKKVGEVIPLDTTQIGFAASNKVYSTVVSDDKQRIMVFKINNRNQKVFVFTTLLYNNALELQKRDRMAIDMEERNDFFTDFLLTNEGELVFGKFVRTNSNSEYITKAWMVTKYPDSADFSIRPIETNNRVLDEIKLKVDNSNKRILFTAFYYKQRRGNIEGLYSLKWDKVNNTKISDTAFAFNDELRMLAKSDDANKKMAFNDFFIKNVIIRKDGGFAIISEAAYTTSRGNAFNRWDYMNWYNPWMTPTDYYYWSPYSAYGRWNRWGNSPSTRYFTENILLLSFSKEGNLEWSNVITKSQYDDETDNMISYGTMNTGGEIHFLFNQLERRNLLLNDQSVGPDGKISRNPTLKNLDRGYQFMPRYAKQVSARQLIVPCWYRNYLCFAKIEF